MSRCVAVVEIIHIIIVNIIVVEDEVHIAELGPHLDPIYI